MRQLLFLLIVSRIHIFGVIKKRKENINNGKTEITKQVLKVRRGFLEITRKVSCMPRMFCIKKNVSGKVEEYILVYTTNTDCGYRVDRCSSREEAEEHMAQ